MDAWISRNIGWRASTPDDNEALHGKMWAILWYLGAAELFSGISRAWSSLRFLARLCDPQAGARGGLSGVDALDECQMPDAPPQTRAAHCR